MKYNSNVLLYCIQRTATYCCCCISTLALTCFRLTKGRAAFFRLEKICGEFLASNGVIFQSDIQSYFKTPVCGAPFSYDLDMLTSKLNSLLVRNSLFCEWRNQFRIYYCILHRFCRDTSKHGNSLFK